MKQGGGQKGASSESEVEGDFSQGLPQEYLPQDLNRFSNRDTLKADLQYRQMKLETHFREELEGKSYTEREELIKQHQKAREAFDTGVKSNLKAFDEMYKKDPESTGKGLR